MDKGCENMQLDYISLGKAIRSLRIAQNWSQEVLSGLSDIPRSHLSAIETGSKKANLDTLGKIAAAFDMPLSELIRKAEELKSNNE